MFHIKRRFESLKKFRFLSKPTKMGEKILLLATAPCVKDYFEYESVRKQFEGYDLAFINYMILYSQEELFKYKPKYVILFDPIFYEKHYFGEGNINQEREKVREVLEKINWECYLLTSVLADFEIANSNIKYLRLSCFEIPFKKWVIPLYRRNLVNMGLFNVMQGSLFFAITFGYKEIAILGCTYQMAEMYRKEDGVHIYGYQHYYDMNPIYEKVSLQQLQKMKHGYIAYIYERGRRSLSCFWNLNKYACLYNARIINYSEGSAIDAFQYGKLNKQ